jgi:hypothetical protein
MVLGTVPDDQRRALGWADGDEAPVTDLDEPTAVTENANLESERPKPPQQAHPPTLSGEDATRPRWGAKRSLAIMAVLITGAGLLFWSRDAPVDPTPPPAAVTPNRGSTVSAQETLAGAGNAFGEGIYRGLIIGVNAYDSAKWPALTAANRDAQALYDLLIGRYGFSAKHTQLLLDPQAAQVESAFVDLVDDVGPDDAVLIYFAGHGSYVGKDPTTAKASCWILKDSTTTPGSCMGALSSNDVQGFIAQMGKARHVFLAVDSCFSGHFAARSGAPDARSRGDTRARYLNPLALESREVLASGDPNREVRDRGASGHSPFAEVILRQLRNPPAGYVSTTDLRVALYQAYNAHKAGYRASAGTLRGHAGGEFVFVRADLQPGRAPGGHDTRPPYPRPPSPGASGPAPGGNNTR